MFGLGFWELAVIIVVILVVFRPEDIPKLLRNLGKITRQLKDVYRGATSAITDISRQIEEPIDDAGKLADNESLWKDPSAGKADSEEKHKT